MPLLPLTSFDATSFNIPQHLNLADPQFNISRSVDILMGASCFWDLMLAGRKSLDSIAPRMQETLLGWVIAGRVPFTTPEHRNFCVIGDGKLSNDVLVKFWSTEEPQLNTPVMSQDEKLCENHFTSTTKRDSSRRFVVQILCN